MSRLRQRRCGAIRNSPPGVAKILRCPAQATRRVEFFAARGALDIERRGRQLWRTSWGNAALAREPLDLFTLDCSIHSGRLNLGAEDSPRSSGAARTRKRPSTPWPARPDRARWAAGSSALAIPDSRQNHGGRIWRRSTRASKTWPTPPLLKDVVAYHEKEKEAKTKRERKPSRNDCWTPGSPPPGRARTNGKRAS
jgi:DNA ligase (NAD+)